MKTAGSPAESTRTATVPPSSTQMPAPGTNFTVVPAPIVSVTPSGTTTQSRTTTTPSHRASAASRPPTTRAPALSVSTSVTFVAKARRCTPSASAAVSHAPEARGVPSQVAPFHGCTHSKPVATRVPRASTRTGAEVAAHHAIAPCEPPLPGSTGTGSSGSSVATCMGRPRHVPSASRAASQAAAWAAG